ncbi:MAG: hypothetical protein AB7O56_13500 [Bauldia sp.]
MAIVLASTAVVFVAATLFSAVLLGREQERAQRIRVRSQVRQLNGFRRRDGEGLY